MTPEQHWEIVDRQRRNLETRYTPLIAMLFEAEGKRAMHHLLVGFPWESAIQENAWIALLIELWKDASITFGGGVAQELGLFLLRSAKAKPRPTKVYDPWSDAYQRKVRRIAAKHARDITKYTEDKLRQIFTTSPDADVLRVAEEFRQAFAQFQATRSNTIAATEVGMAIGTATSEAAIVGGARYKRWITQRDERVRPTHAHQDNLRILVTDTFPNGLRYPGDPEGKLSEIINCRCVLIFS